MKLQQRFVMYAVLMIAASIIVGFAVSNVLYVAFVKEQINDRYLSVLEEFTEQIELDQITLEETSSYLYSKSKLGYQIALVAEEGTMHSYGVPFEEMQLTEQMASIFKDGETTYNGIENARFSGLMMSHFENSLSNTVGLKVAIEGKDYGLFLRTTNSSMFSEMHLVLFGFVIAAFVISVVGILLISRKLIRTISELTAATEEIANHNFDYPLTITGKDEIGKLADSFRMMQEKLANTDETRRKFINNVSHDFQSPLLNILGYSELLQEEIASEEGKQYNSVIQTEAKRLSNLTKQLLTLTSLDQGTYPINKQEVRIDEQLHSVVRSFMWRIQEKELEIDLDLSPTQVYGDRTLLMNAWENLLSNAIKYNNEFGYIIIRTYETEKAAFVEIEDTGIGMEQESVDHIFERFYRVDKARNKEGMGLGLSIVHEVLTYHQATIHVNSELGKGTKFKIGFPK